MKNEMTKHVEITKIEGSLTRSSVAELYKSFKGKELQYVINNEVKSFCYLNTKEMFPNGMFKIDSIYDSIEKVDDEIYYYKKCECVSLDELNFVKTENDYTFRSSSISNFYDSSAFLIDFYDVGTQGDYYAQKSDDTILIKDISCNSVQDLYAKIKNKNGFVYFALPLSSNQTYKIMPAPDFQLNINDDESGSYRIICTDGTLTNGENITLSNSIDGPVIKYATQKDIEYVYENVINEVQSKYVQTVNGHEPVNGDVTITQVHKAEIAETTDNLLTTDYFNQKAAFSFRTSGGDDNIETGTGYLQSIQGNAQIGESTPSNLTTESSTLTVEVDETKFLAWLYNWEELTKLTNTYTFSYNNNNWTCTVENITTTISNTDLYSQTGIAVNKDASFDTDDNFTIKYQAEIYSDYVGVQLNKFYSIGYNLYDYNEHKAHVTGGDAVRIIYERVHNFKFVPDNGGEVQSITLEDFTVGLTTIDNAYIPPSNGYIMRSDSDGNSDTDIMINLIWSGKRIDDVEYQNYIKNVIDFTEFNNGKSISLNYVNGRYDELDLWNSKKIQRIGVVPSNKKNAFIFATTVYIDTGDTLYVDFSTLDAGTYERWYNTYGQLHPNVLPSVIWNEESNPPTVISFETSKILNIVYPQGKTKDDFIEYAVDDFGQEGFELIDENVSPTAKILYKANLIDKLRRSVLTYSLQEGVTNEQQSFVYQNLGLIKVNCYISNNEVEVTAINEDDDSETLSAVGVNKYASFVLPHLGNWRFETIINKIKVVQTLNIQYFGEYEIRLAGKRYGFRRSKNISDGEQRITYIEDAEGFIPVSFQTDEEQTKIFDPGSWGQFISEVAAPVLLNVNGNISYLDPDDQSKFLDGSSVDWDDIISAHNQQAMVEFRKYIYVKRYEDKNYEYVIFTDEKPENDPGFLNQAGISIYDNSNESNNHLIINDRFYWGMYEGSAWQVTDTEDAYGTSTTLTQLWSLPTSGFAAAYATTALGMEQYANNVRYVAGTSIGETTRRKSRWHIGYKSGYDFICDLITLISKTDDVQTVFGNGRYRGQVQEFVNGAGFTNIVESGGFVYGGDSSTADMVKIFWICNFYGNRLEPLAGYIRKNNSAASNGATLGNTNFLIKMQLDNENNQYGYFPETYSSTKNDAFTLLGYDLLTSVKASVNGGYGKNAYTGEYGTIIYTGQSDPGYMCDWVSFGKASKTTYIGVTGAYATNIATLPQDGPRSIADGNYASALASANYLPRLTYV